MVTIQDRRHPLFGRTFRLAYRRKGFAGPGGRIRVFYRDDLLIELPADSVDDHRIELPGTKLSLEGAEELWAAARRMELDHASEEAFGEACPPDLDEASSPSWSARWEG